MATKPKDNKNSSSSSKSSSTRNSKKLATVSSNSQVPTHKQPISPKPNPTSPKPTSTSLSKSVPNYLKPTFSSRSESLKLGNSKKSSINTSEDASKEKLLRRRSFDRPPSASRGAKSLISPDRKERLGSRDKPSPLDTRASSFSGSRTPISGSKLATAKSFKPVKSLAATEINVNRSLSFSRTKTSTTKDASRSLKPQNVEIKQEKVEEVKTQKDERKEEENGDRELHLDNIDLNVKDDEEDDLTNPKEISTIITLEEENFLQQTHVEDLGSEIEFRQGDREEEEELRPICSDCKNNNNDDDVPKHKLELGPEPEEGVVVKNILVDDAKVESGHEEKEMVKNSNENADSSMEEEKNENKAKEGEEDEVEIGVAEEMELEKEEEKVKEEDEPEEEEEEESSDNGNEVQKSSQGGQENNKKETPTAYNDVIEETKNKLLEKRKNKVKALVGAFETVIDYETAGSK